MMLGIATPVIWVLLSLVALLAMSSLVIRLQQIKNPHKNQQELQARIRSWWVILILFSLAIVIHPVISLIFFAFLSFLALKEYLSLIPTRRADHQVLFWAYAAIPVQYYWIGLHWYGMFVIFIPVFAFLFLPMRMVLRGETDGFLKAVGTLHWGLMLMVFNLSHVAYLLVLPAEKNISGSGGAGLVLFIIICTQLNDIAQYVWGKSFGKHKVIPKVSPNKTWEGLLGGVFTTTLLSVFLAPWLTPLSSYYAVLAGILISMSGFIGDVTISALKRDLGVKDSGNLIPGHGGILDRVDSLTFTAPLFFHLIYYLYY